MILLHDKDQQ